MSGAPFWLAFGIFANIPIEKFARMFIIFRSHYMAATLFSYGEYWIHVNENINVNQFLRVNSLSVAQSSGAHLLLQCLHRTVSTCASLRAAAMRCTLRSWEHTVDLRCTQAVADFSQRFELRSVLVTATWAHVWALCKNIELTDGR